MVLCWSTDKLQHNQMEQTKIVCEMVNKNCSQIIHIEFGVDMLIIVILTHIKVCVVYLQTRLEY